MTTSTTNAISPPPVIQFSSIVPASSNNVVIIHDEREQDEKDQNNSHRNSSHIHSRSNGRALSRSRSTTEKCKNALTYMLGLASMGAIGFMSYSRNDDERFIIEDGCTAIARINNTRIHLINNSSKTHLISNSSIPCRNSSDITDECIDSLGLAPWTVAVDTLLASFPILFLLTIKAVNKYLRSKGTHTSRLDEKVRVCSCVSTTLIQSISALALILIAGSLQDDRCDDFCNDNYAATFCALDMTETCKTSCHLIPVFTSIAATFLMQIVLSTPCICAEYRITKSSRHS